MNRKVSPGVDAVDYKMFSENLDENIEQLTSDLKGKRYHASLVKRRYIPKGTGRRPLGIQIVGDNVVQTGVVEILISIYEEDFLPISHGYRRGRGPQKTALELSSTLQRGLYRYVVDADIKGFFDNIYHDWMIRMLFERISDQSFLDLIMKWLKAGILEEDGSVIYPITGRPQGGVVSAVLANIYLHYGLDLWFEKVVKVGCHGQVSMMRFADDFVCCFQHEDDALGFHESLGKRLSKFNLTLSEEKTRLLRFSRFETEKNTSFVFLGFDYRWGVSRSGKSLVRMSTSSKKYKAALESMREWIKGIRGKKRITGIFRTLKQKLQGHWNYYGVCGNSERLRSYLQEIRQIVHKWLNRRSQRKSYNWDGFSAIWKHFRIPNPRIIGYWDRSLPLYEAS
jgi:RNA-directed DNA polymerase